MELIVVRLFSSLFLTMLSLNGFRSSGLFRSFRFVFPLLKGCPLRLCCDVRLGNVLNGNNLANTFEERALFPHSTFFFCSLLAVRRRRACRP
ncbi:hypothetical protein XENOCAPTIV_016064 [Xenoophorus captivus]|uniref:Secreted protein n=1 Tax=Xenoophorus captivus TaxID=1517983 RepID=A0ABV0QVM6_9TELE